MRHWQAATLLFFGFLVTGPSAVAQEDTKKKVRPPNVVVILVDDLGYGDLSFLGSPDMKSPRIDSLAKDGT